jgi:hypothetical protein
MQETPANDPFLGWATADGREFRVRRIEPEQRRLSVSRLIERLKAPGWGKKDFRAMAADIGRLLARGHARARAEDGSAGLTALAAAVGDGRGLCEETAAYAMAAGDVVDVDFDLFREILRQRGPLLGAAGGR